MSARGLSPAPRRTLLEWFLGRVTVEVPSGQLAAALATREGETGPEWLTRAATILGWHSDVVDASPRSVSGERESWWVATTRDGRERWVVLTGERSEESRASVIDAQTAQDIPMEPEPLAEALGLGDPSEVIPWVRVTPTLPLERLRSPPEGPKLAPFDRLRRWARLERPTILAVVAYSAIVGTISLALPLAVQSLVNSLAFGRVLQPILVISAGLLFLLSLAAALRVLEVYIVELLLRRMFADVARDAARRLPAALPATGGKWGLTERINRFFDVVTAQKATSFLLLNATEVVMSTLTGLLVLAFYHPYLLVFDLVLVVSLGIVLFPLGRGGIRTAVEESHAKYELAAWLESMARRSKRFASPEAAAWGTRHTERLLVDWLHERAQHFRIVLRQTIGLASIQALASAMLLGLGAFLVYRGELSLGQLVASELIITSVLAQLAKFGKHVELFYDLNASADKIGVLLDLDTENPAGELLDERPKGLRLEVRDIELAGRVSAFALEPGDRMGIERLPNAGRQALVDYIYGHRTPPSGAVLLDGITVTALAPRTRRRHLALIAGERPVGATLEENLTSQDARITSADVREALERVGLAERVGALPKGLATWIHPDGNPLSSGELVALETARATLRRPRFILVDHALDGLDDGALAPIWAALTPPDAPWTLLVTSARRDLLGRCPRLRRLYRFTGRGLVEVPR